VFSRCLTLPPVNRVNSQASNVIWSVRLIHNELGKHYTMVARAGRITKRVTETHRDPVKRTLYYAVQISRTKRERENCVTQQRQWISIRKLIRHLRPARRDRRRAAKKWDGRRKRSVGGTSRRLTVVPTK
jgi:hypothetical protein